MFWKALDRLVLLLGSFSVKAWKGVTAVPGGSPVAPPKVLVEPKLPKPVPVLEAVLVLPAPNREPPVFAVPKPPAGLLALPNRPPPVVLLPNAEGVVVLVFDPNPPKPVPVLLGVLEAPKRPPEAGVVVGVEPKAGLLPKPPVFDPKPPKILLELEEARRWRWILSRRQGQ